MTGHASLVTNAIGGASRYHGARDRRHTELHLCWHGETLNRPSAGQAAALGATSIGAAAIAVGVAQIELSGQAQPHIWSNAWLLAALALAGTGLVIATLYFVMPMFAREKSKPKGDGAKAAAEPSASQTHEVPQQDPDDREAEEQAPRARAVPTRHGAPNGLIVPAETEAQHGAFTRRWRTGDGFEKPPLAEMSDLTMPGFAAAHGQSPQIRIGVCVACHGIPAGRPVYALDQPRESLFPQAPGLSPSYAVKLLDFLQGDPVSTLINAVVCTDGMIWTPQADHAVHMPDPGWRNLEAVLGHAGDNDPQASALLELPLSNEELFGNQGLSLSFARFWLHIDPRGRDGGAPTPTGLAGWYQRFLLAIAVTRPFADFLAEGIRVGTSDDPAARAGVMIRNVGPLIELVDQSDLTRPPGKTSANKFLGYIIADREGKPPNQVARDLLRQLGERGGWEV